MLKSEWHLIDSHSHIYGERFDLDRSEVLARACDAGVRQLLQVGCNLEESREVVALAAAWPGVYAAVGVHPHDASSVTPDVLDAIEALVPSPKVVAWGEIGLDFYYDSSPRDLQVAAFEAQLLRARRLDLPVVIHTRDAEPETLELLKRHPLPRGGQVHCFTGTQALAEALLELGFHIGFTGIITFKNAQALRDVVAITPLERLLIETDSPYLAPIPQRGKRNEPAYVGHVAKAVAEVKGLDPAEVAAVTSANFYKLYGRGIQADTGENWERLARTQA